MSLNRQGLVIKRPKIEEPEDEECMSVGSMRREENQEHSEEIELNGRK